MNGKITKSRSKISWFATIVLLAAMLGAHPVTATTYISDSPTNNSMLFLKPAATKQEFITGLSTAASTTPEATYVTLNNHGQPTTAKAGIAFPGNDWIAFPDGDQYLAKLGNASPGLLTELAALRQRHLQAVANLLDAIEKGKVNLYLNNQFKCPTQ